MAGNLLLGLTAAAGLWCLAAAASRVLPVADLEGLPMAAALLAGFGWLAVLARVRDRAQDTRSTRLRPESAEPAQPERADGDPEQEEQHMAGTGGQEATP